VTLQLPRENSQALQFSWVIVFLPRVSGDKPLLNLEIERAE